MNPNVTIPPNEVPFRSTNVRVSMYAIADNAATLTLTVLVSVEELTATCSSPGRACGTLTGWLLAVDPAVLGSDLDVDGAFGVPGTDANGGATVFAVVPYTQVRAERASRGGGGVAAGAWQGRADWGREGGWGKRWSEARSSRGGQGQARGLWCARLVSGTPNLPYLAGPARPACPVPRPRRARTRPSPS